MDGTQSRAHPPDTGQVPLDLCPHHVQALLLVQVVEIRRTLRSFLRSRLRELRRQPLAGDGQGSGARVGDARIALRAIVVIGADQYLQP